MKYGGGADRIIRLKDNKSKQGCCEIQFTAAPEQEDDLFVAEVVFQFQMERFWDFWLSAWFVAVNDKGVKVGIGEESGDQGSGFTDVLTQTYCLWAIFIQTEIDVIT